MGYLLGQAAKIQENEKNEKNYIIFFAFGNYGGLFLSSPIKEKDNKSTDSTSYFSGKLYRCQSCGMA